MKLEARNLGYKYSAKGQWIFRNINLVIEAGQRIALLGESGKGKSTLAKLLAGYLTPTEGEILPLVSLDKKNRKSFSYNPVQLIHQHPEKAINPRFKMHDVISEGFPPSEGLLSSLGIENNWLNRYPSELSGGEMQRFCIARTLGPKTKFIIADEISTMLDAVSQAHIWAALLEEAGKRNIGLLVVTHDKALAEKVCGDRVIWL